MPVAASISLATSCQDHLVKASQNVVWPKDLVRLVDGIQLPTQHICVNSNMRKTWTDGRFMFVKVVPIDRIQRLGFTVVSVRDAGTC